MIRAVRRSESTGDPATTFTSSPKWLQKNWKGWESPVQRSCGVSGGGFAVESSCAICLCCFLLTPTIRAKCGSWQLRSVSLRLRTAYWGRTSLGWPFVQPMRDNSDKPLYGVDNLIGEYGSSFINVPWKLTLLSFRVAYFGCYGAGNEWS